MLIAKNYVLPIYRDVNILKYTTNNPKETKSLGRNLAKMIKSKQKYHSQVILLTGDLGAGKTVFVKGLAEGLALDFNITSPTFNLINEYEGNPGLIHMDFYRIDNKEELIQLGLEEYLNMNWVKAIEWPQLIFEYINDDFLFIKIVNINEDKREITIKAEGNNSKKLLEGMKANVSTGN